MSVSVKEPVLIFSAAMGAVVLGVVFSHVGMEGRRVVEAPRLRYGKDREDRDPDAEEIDYLTFKEAMERAPYLKNRASKDLDALGEALREARSVYTDPARTDQNSNLVYDRAHRVKDLGETLVDFARDIFAQDRARLAAVLMRK